jgi:hypothetical protein
VTTDPDVRAEAGRILDRMSLEEQDAIAADGATLQRRRTAQRWPDDLAEILQGPYVPGDLKMHALGLPEAA